MSTDTSMRRHAMPVLRAAPIAQRQEVRRRRQVLDGAPFVQLLVRGCAPFFRVHTVTD
jgi:hypothetical protein